MQTTRPIRRTNATLACLLLATFAAQSACRDNKSATTSGAPVETTLQPIRQGGTERPTTLVFGLTPYLPEEQLRRDFEPLVRYIGDAVNIPTQLRIASSYDELSRLLADYEVHLALFSPFNYIRAKQLNPGIILLATHIADGSSSYSGYIVVHEDSGITEIEQLRGKRFAFVDRHSTSGYLYPLAYLRSLNYEPDTFFGSIEFSGNHTRVVDRVVGGQVDGGAIFSTAFKDAAHRRLRIIAKTGRIPYDAYCASPRLQQDLVNQIRDAMLKINTRSEEGRRILGGVTALNGFVVVGDDHYDDVRRVERLVQQGTSTSP